MLRATLLGSFIALASGQGSATCTITGSINSYPSVRRSGTSANSYSPAPHFDAIIANFPAMDAFVSDVGLNWIDIIRTSEVDEGFNGWGVANCAHAPQCGTGISNATVAGNYKKDFLEEHDVRAPHVCVGRGEVEEWWWSPQRQPPHMVLCCACVRILCPPGPRARAAPRLPRHAVL